VIDTLSNVGGLIEIFFLLIHFLYNVYNSYHMRKDMLHDIYLQDELTYKQVKAKMSVIGQAFMKAA
jgi:hypothetical protein